MALLAAGVLLGGFSMQRLPVAFGALALGLAVGLVLGAPTGDPSPWLFGLAGVTGAIAALAPGRALPLATLLSLIAGFLIAWASLPDPGPPRDRAFTMAGSVTGTALALLYLAGGIDVLRDRLGGPWLSVGLRIVAAWIAAVALLMTALHFNPPQA
jgi:hypothetical protein